MKITIALFNGGFTHFIGRFGPSEENRSESEMFNASKGILFNAPQSYTDFMQPSYALTHTGTDKSSNKSCSGTPWIVVAGAYIIPLPTGFFGGIIFMICCCSEQRGKRCCVKCFVAAKSANDIFQETE